MVGIEKFWKVALVASLVATSPLVVHAEDFVSSLQLTEPELRLGDTEDEAETGLLLLSFKVNGEVANPEDVRYEVADTVEGWAIHEGTGLVLQEDGSYTADTEWNVDFAQCGATTKYTVSLLEGGDDLDEPNVLASVELEVSVSEDYCTKAGILDEEGDE